MIAVGHQHPLQQIMNVHTMEFIDEDCLEFTDDIDC